MEYIADVGTAWCGDLDLLDYMVGRLKSAGATAFKPQVWPKSIYRGHELEREARRCHLHKRAIKKVEAIAERHGLEVFYSVFNMNCLKRVMFNTNARRVKFSHSMRTDGKLIAEAVRFERFEQVIISVEGFQDFYDNVNPELLKHMDPCGAFEARENFRARAAKVKLLYCVPNYPTNEWNLNFKNMGELTGFSDHTTGVLAPVVATALGAQMIEKHVMCNKDEYLCYLGEMPRFPDEVCAVSLDKFGLMVGECKITQEMMG